MTSEFSEFSGVAGRGDLADQAAISLIKDQIMIRRKVQPIINPRPTPGFLARQAKGIENICAGRDCGAEISAERRAAEPYTILCLCCKERSDALRRQRESED